ncbi:hypothetical protein T261_1660 [Streptomyces lydicus]|nr:hypothetical protein T261_1660 [Streptomyces lydicus]
MGQLLPHAAPCTPAGHRFHPGGAPADRAAQADATRLAQCPRCPLGAVRRCGRAPQPSPPGPYGQAAPQQPGYHACER